MASLGDTGDLLDVQLRKGAAHTAEGALDFILPLLDRVEKRLCQVAAARIDAGFPEEKLLGALEERRTPYLARVRNNAVLDRMAEPLLKRPPGRRPTEPRTWFHEMTYRAESWSRERRVVLVVLERPDDLFIHHFWIITNWTVEQMNGEALLEHYRERGSAENHMGELMDVFDPALSSSPRSKTSYRGHRIDTAAPPCESFAHNETILLLNALAYNIAAMLAAIESAQRSISLVSYIFDNDASGKQFADALGRAAKRGVAVRVLVDAAGARYSWPPITHRLNRAGVRCAKFLPASLLTPWRVATINLRNHRKILVVDGQSAFTGGMNIRSGNVLAGHPRSPVQDLHFRIEGPVVAQLQEAFVNDWAFTTGETVDGEAWFPRLRGDGSVTARVITDGPDADLEKARWTLLAALAEAQTSAQILTPYFLPDSALVTALNLAALRGVRVDILLPSKNNLFFVQWASRAMWWQLLQRGCHVWLTLPPFDHSKLMVVDGHWVLLGSANWDARSLRLNFELNVECYGRELARDLATVIQEKLHGAHEVTLAEVDARTIPGRLRDATARLLSPLL